MEFHYNVAGCFRPPREDVELAGYAADAGFEGVWIGDHFLPWLDNRPYTHHVLPWLGAVMAEVPDVTVGTAVTCPTVRYHPPVLAQAIATLDNMYPGRFELGVGTGEALNEAHFLDGEWPDWETQAAMLIETLDVMETLWESEGYVSYDGEYYDYDEIALYTRPKTDIDVHWAAWGPNSIRCAGEFAGNLLTTAPAEAIEGKMRPVFEEGLVEGGRDPADAHVTCHLSAHYGDPADLVAEIRERGEHIPEGELDNPDPRDIQAVANRELASMSDAEVADANNVTDDPETFVDLVSELEDAGVTRVLVVSKAGDSRETIDAFAEHVIPKF
jgi:coenzyme F420-dependent glucose-6-phosphate dehydrogenase